MLWRSKQERGEDLEQKKDVEKYCSGPETRNNDVIL
jgi:hypothetical protein